MLQATPRIHGIADDTGPVLLRENLSRPRSRSRSSVVHTGGWLYWMSSTLGMSASIIYASWSLAKVSLIVVVYRRRYMHVTVGEELYL